MDVNQTSQCVLFFLFFFSSPSVFIKQHPAFTKVHRSGTAEDNCAHVCICMLADRCLPAEIMNARTRKARTCQWLFLIFSTVVRLRWVRVSFPASAISMPGTPARVSHLEPSSLIELMYKWR